MLTDKISMMVDFIGNLMPTNCRSTLGATWFTNKDLQREDVCTF